jgi:hypothetical protein
MSVIEYPKGFKRSKLIVVEDSLWQRFKKKVLSNGHTLTFVLTNLIKQYLDGDKKD